MKNKTRNDESVHTCGHTHDDEEATGRRPLEYIAFWQFMSFILLLCVIWADAVLDVQSMILGKHEGRDTPWMSACLLSAAVIVIGFITIGNTYIQQKRVLKGFIKVCSYCRKVEIDRDAWEHMETFVEDHTLAEFTHGVCPDCMSGLIRDHIHSKKVQPDADGKPVA